MIPPEPKPEYEGRLREILMRRDWAGLREFTRTENQVPDDVYEQPQHFWEVLLHKLTCSKLELVGLHGESRQWLETHGYSSDLGGF
mgnify:CR=1 FL=1